MSPRDVGRDSLRLCELLRFLHQAAITRLGPWFDRAIVERLARIRDDKIQIEVDRVAESLTARAGAPRIVKREEPWLRFLINRAVVLAFEAVVENEALASHFGGAVDWEFENGLAVPFPVANLDRIDQAGARFRTHREPVDDNPNRFREIDVEQSFRRRKLVQAAILIEAIKSALLNVDQCVAHGVLGGRQRLFPQQAPSGWCRGLRGCNAQLVDNIKPSSRSQRQDLRRDLIRIVAPDERAALDAVRLSTTGK